MSIFSRIFGLQSKSENSEMSDIPEIIRIKEFDKKLHSLLDQDAYDQQFERWYPANYEV